MTIRTFRISTLMILILSVYAGNAQSHEFWLDPVSAIDDQSTNLKVDIRVGQNFAGEAFYYIPGDIKKANITDAKGTYKLERNVGDIPVFDQKVRAPGLQIISYATTPNQLTYNKPEKFQNFLKHAGIEWVLTEHKKRGLPDAGFTEKFVRYAKALMVRTNNNGQDKILGLQFELLALKNPYQLSLQDGGKKLPVQAFWQGKPFPNGLMTIFEKGDNKAGEKVLKSQIRLNENGIANVPIKAGKKYLLNVVHMTAIDKKSGGVWKSHWASLTFSTAKSQ